METATKNRPRVLLIFGGQSGEHGISCATAAGIYSVIDQDKYQVTAVGITPGGHWVPIDFTSQDFALGEAGAAIVAESEKQIALTMGNNESLVFTDNGRDKPIDAHFFGEFDVVFPVLHGPYGEDGTIQGLLEMAGVRYVGCGVLASAVSMDKPVTKTLLQAAGIPVGRWEALHQRDWNHYPEKNLARIKGLGLPVFVKPARAGSSLGVSKVVDYDELDTALEEAFIHDPAVIIEEAHDGLEVECAVLQREDGYPQTTQPGCIAMDGQVEFYDYETKYFGQRHAQMQIPADIPPVLAARVRSLAARAFQVLQCEGLARVDFFVNPVTNTIIFNEINTMPGFTPYSMYPAMWQAEGIGYQSLVDRLLQLALKRPIGLR